MTNDDGFHSIFSINQSGKITLENEFAPVQLWQDVKTCHCNIPKIKENRNFVVGDDWNGIKYCY